MMRSDGPVEATFKYYDKTLGTDVTFDCTLDGLSVDVELDEAKQVEFEDSMGQTLVCFGTDLVSRVVLRETTVHKNDAGRYGRIRSTSHA